MNNAISVENKLACANTRMDAELAYLKRKADGERFRELRHSLGLTQVKAAKLFSFSRTTITNIELGRQPMPLYFEEIMQMLDVEMSNRFGLFTNRKENFFEKYPDVYKKAKSIYYKFEESKGIGVDALEVKRIRKKLNVKQSELSRIVGYDNHSMISLIENGRVKDFKHCLDALRFLEGVFNEFLVGNFSSKEPTIMSYGKPIVSIIEESALKAQLGVKK